MLYDNHTDTAPSTQDETRTYKRPRDFGEMRLATQKRDLRLLHTGIRKSRLSFSRWLAVYGIDIDHVYGWGDLGVIVGFTAAEDERFATDPMGRKDTTHKRKGRIVVVTGAGFSRHLSPADEDKEQCEKRRRKFRYQQRKQAVRDRQRVVAHDHRRVEGACRAAGAARRRELRHHAIEHGEEGGFLPRRPAASTPLCRFSKEGWPR
jgi:hypothetical protein